MRHDRAVPRTTLLLLIACILIGPAASAHTLTTPRMVHVRVSEDRVEIAVAWLFHAGPEAAHLRSRFDRDGNGTLSDEEQDLIAAWLQRRVEGAVVLTLDGVRLRPEVGAMDLSLMRDDEADDEGLQFGSRAAILLCPRPGAHELVVQDRPDQPAHTVPLRVDVAWPVTATSTEGEAMPLEATADGALAGGGFAGAGGRVSVRFDVPEGSVGQEPAAPEPPGAKSDPSDGAQSPPAR